MAASRCRCCAAYVKRPNVSSDNSSDILTPKPSCWFATEVLWFSGSQHLKSWGTLACILMNCQRLLCACNAVSGQRRGHFSLSRCGGVVGLHGFRTRPVKRVPNSQNFSCASSVLGRRAWADRVQSVQEGQMWLGHLCWDILRCELQRTNIIVAYNHWIPLVSFVLSRP